MEEGTGRGGILPDKDDVPSADCKYTRGNGNAINQVETISTTTTSSDGVADAVGTGEGAVDMQTTASAGDDALKYETDNMVVEGSSYGQKCDQSTPGKRASLHEAVVCNDIRAVSELLQSGRNHIDHRRETDGCTPLHVAIKLGFYEVATYLIFQGADPGLTTTTGQQLSDLCKHSVARTVFSLVSKLNVRHDERRSQCDSIQVSKHKAQFRNIDVSIRSVGELPSDDVTVRCRSVRFEDAGMNLSLKDNETLCSDGLVFCTTRTDRCEVQVWVPLYRAPNMDEMLGMITNDGQSIQIDQIVREKKRCFCTCSVALSGLLVLAAVTTPRTEIFTIGVDPICLRSQLEPKLKLSFQIGTYTQPANIHLHIKDVSSLPTMLTESQCVFSSTPLYLFDGNDVRRQQRDVTYYVPLPTNFDDSAQLIVLVACDEDLAGTDDGWNILASEIITRGRFKCSARQIRGLVGLQFAQSVPEDRCAVIAKRHLNQLYRSVCHEEFSVVFHVLSKSADEQESCQLRHVVVTCCLTSQLEDVVRTWQSDGYSVDLCTDLCKTFAKQTFCITLCDTMAFCDGQSQELLQFHLKRNNYVQFTARMISNDTSVKVNQVTISQIYTHKGDTVKDICVKVPLSVMKYKETRNSSAVNLPSAKYRDNVKMPNTDNTSRGNSSSVATHAYTALQNPKQGYMSDGNAQDVLGNLNESSLTALSHLPEPASYITPVEQVVQAKGHSLLPGGVHGAKQTAKVESTAPCIQHATTKHMLVNSMSSTEPEELFFHDSFLRSLLDDIGDDWCSVLVLMGIPFAAIDSKLPTHATEHGIQNALFELLLQWRHDNSNRDDRGVPHLLSALRKGGRWSLSITVQKRLKTWHDEVASRDDPLFLWLDQAYCDSDLYIPGDYPPPMSDKFLVMFAPHLPPSDSLAYELALTPEQLGDVHQSTCANTTLIVMKILTVFRNQPNKLTDQLAALLRGMENIGFRSATSAAVTSLMGWLYKSAPINDPLRKPLERLLRKYKHVIGGLQSRRVLEPFDHKKRLPARTAARILRTGDPGEEYGD